MVKMNHSSSENAIRKVLEKIPFIQEIEFERPSGQSIFLVRFLSNDKPVLLLVKEILNGEPRWVRQAIFEVLLKSNTQSAGVPVIIAPFISDKSAQLCQENGTGYFDLAGNCHLELDTIYIDQHGNPNLYSSKKINRSLYSPRAERILRVLLNKPGKKWGSIEMAGAANVSLGQVSNVKKILIDKEWAKMTRDGINLINPAALLDEWSVNYDFGRNITFNVYTMQTPAEAEASLAHMCEMEELQYALTGFSAAEKISPMVRNQKISAYVTGNITEAAGRLGWKLVESGANVLLLTPYDTGVFTDRFTVDDIYNVSNIQLYLDLLKLHGRGNEAAEAVRREIIKKW